MNHNISSYFSKDGILRQQIESSPTIQWATIGIILLIFLMFIVSPYLNWRETRFSSVQQSIIQLERLESIEQERAVILSDHQRIRGEFAQAQSYLLDSPSFNAATARLLPHLESLFRPLGLSFDTRRFGEPIYVQWVGEEVPTRWRWIGSSQSIMDMIYQLADSPILVVPESIDIRPRRARSGEIQYEMSANLVSYRQFTLEQMKHQQRVAQ